MHLKDQGEGGGYISQGMRSVFRYANYFHMWYGMALYRVAQGKSHYEHDVKKFTIISVEGAYYISSKLTKGIDRIQIKLILNYKQSHH